MKGTFTLLFALLSVGFANAQTYTVDANANWQQLIPTILGGNCVQISNVTYNAGPNAAAVYTNFPGFGDGILLTTGVAQASVGPNNNTSTGFNNNLPGSPLLNQQLGGGYFTYDATSLEFNFVASYSGYVTVDYIFASEEYPEYVNSSYNDIFGFFVSGPNIQGGQQNIALVPGTQIPVAINNVNQFLNTSYYVDNINGTQVQYDGYTTPLTAQFYADSGAVYTLSIIIADAGDGVFDSGVFLKTYATTTQSVTGNITHQGQPATAGVAELFGYNTDSTAAPLLDSQPISNGSYTFSNVASGAYNIRVTLDTNVYPGTYPAYFDSAFVWTDADIITTPCQNYDLGMQLMVLNNGPGTITGTIGNTSDQIEKSLSTPSVGAHVILAGLTDGNIYGFDLTDANGNFSFTNVPLGDYKLLIDVPGLYMDSIRIISLTSDNKVFTNQSYLIGANKIIVTETPLGVGENKIIKGLSVAPNPAQNTIIVNFNLVESTRLTAELVDVTGKTVISVYSGDMGVGTQTIQANIGALDNGIYFLRIVTSNGTARVKKIVKTGIN